MAVWPCAQSLDLVLECYWIPGSDCLWAMIVVETILNMKRHFAVLFMIESNLSFKAGTDHPAFFHFYYPKFSCFPPVLGFGSRL